MSLILLAIATATLVFSTLTSQAEELLAGQITISPLSGTHLPDVGVVDITFFISPANDEPVLDFVVTLDGRDVTAAVNSVLVPRMTMDGISLVAIIPAVRGIDIANGNLSGYPLHTIKVTVETRLGEFSAQATYNVVPTVSYQP